MREQRVWLITGSASGLGREIAKAALRAGDKVIATARHPESLQKLVEKFGPGIRPVKQDVAN